MLSEIGDAKMHTRLISITPDAEQTMLYIARVSSDDQTSGKTGLLYSCLRRGHWSVFEHAHMTLEIVTSRTIGRQILRHKSFSFSEFSQRYQKVIDFETYDGRKPGATERQSSVKPLNPIANLVFRGIQKVLQTFSIGAYRLALAIGVSRECARFLLLETATTRIYMTGSIRSWIHYCAVRSETHTQKEHRDITCQAMEVMEDALPHTYAAMLEYIDAQSS